MKIKFCGAATSVTGSCHMIDTGRYKFLLDCGQFQGTKEMERLNTSPFGFEPSEIDFMILSHAHIDHCGRIPLFVKRGYSAPVYCVDATHALVGIMLKDGAHIQEKEAETKNKKNHRLGRPLVEPLYTAEDVEDTLPLFQGILYNKTVQVNEDIKFVFRDAGHILGSAIIEIFINDRTDDPEGKPVKLVFSGDLGVKGRPILSDPTEVDEADYVIMETTYGDRLHGENASSIDRLIEISINTIRRGGNVIIPAFSVGRTQELIFQFHKFFLEHKEFREEMAATPVYIDSPMAAAATQIFRENAHVFDDDMKEYLLKGYNPLDFENLRFVKTVAESQSINADGTPKVIISASGMCEAGRIKHHLKHNIWNEKNSIVFVGYQAEGTLGRRIVEGYKSVKIFGEEVNVNAEIYNLEGFSGHADKNGLLEWLGGFRRPPVMTFLVHGEQESKIAFGNAVRELLKYPAEPVTGLGAEYDAAAPGVSKDAPGGPDPDSGKDASGSAPAPLAVPTSKVSEGYVPEKSDILMQSIKLRERLFDIHYDLERILYHTQLAADDSLTQEKLDSISDILLELEKNSMLLGSAVTLDNPAGEAADIEKASAKDAPADEK